MWSLIDEDSLNRGSGAGPDVRWRWQGNDRFSCWRWLDLQHLATAANGDMMVPAQYTDDGLMLPPRYLANGSLGPPAMGASCRSNYPISLNNNGSVAVDSAR